VGGSTPLIGDEVPVWDIRDEFGDTDMLVRTDAHGASLARTLGPRAVALMRGHGGVTVGPRLAVAVFTAYYVEQNALLQRQAEALGEVRYLNAGEIERAKAALLGPLALTRVWDHFRRRAEYGGEPDALATERAGMRDA